jgi:hypothetical protein
MKNQNSKETNKGKAMMVGIFILTAYFVLVSAVTTNGIIVLIFEILSGISVIGIAWILYPLFKSYGRKISLLYYLMKWIEGGIMIVGGIMYLGGTETLLEIRDLLYVIHAYIFIISAFLLYYLFIKSELIPKWLAIWGQVAVVLLLIGNILELSSQEIPIVIIGLCLSQIMLNEVVLAVYLIVAGFYKGKNQTNAD